MAGIVIVDYLRADAVDGDKASGDAHTHNAHYGDRDGHCVCKEQRDESDCQHGESEPPDIHDTRAFHDIRPDYYTDKRDAEHHAEHDGCHGAFKFQSILNIERDRLRNERERGGIERVCKAEYPEFAVGDEGEYRLEEIGLLAVGRLRFLFFDILVAAEGHEHNDCKGDNAIDNCGEVIAYL